MTYTLIDSVTLGSSASSVTFSGISGTGKGDLVLVVNAKATAICGVYMFLNNDTGNNYNFVFMSGDGSTASSTSSSSTSVLRGYEKALPDTTFAYQMTSQFLDFSATDKHKPVLTRTNNAARGTDAFAQRWANTAAITTLKVQTTNDLFDVGSTFHLYQIVSE